MEIGQLDPSLFASSPLPAILRHRHHYQNVSRQPITMPLRSLTLRRITANQHHFRFNHTAQPFCIAGQFASVNHHSTMDEQSKNKDIIGGKSDPTTLSVKEEKDKASEKSTPSIPPPPEKPLPGDCCGSGCVRCVWDMYYEELEEYNTLYKADSKVS